LFNEKIKTILKHETALFWSNPCCFEGCSCWRHLRVDRVKSLLSNSSLNKKKRGEKTLGFTDKLYALIFSELSLGLVLPVIFGILIIVFPTILYDALEPVNIYFPDFLWGGPEIPLEHILTQGVAQGLLACAIPIFLGLAWNRWAGGASG
jgi:hypothetical protein